MKKLITLSATLAGAATLVSCSSNADVASQNLSKAADNFEINRRILFINNFTGDTLLQIQGKCNIAVDGDGGGQLEVTCRTEEGDKEHFLGLNANTSYFVEQVDPAQVNGEQYAVFFNPSVLIPNVEMK